MKKYSLLFALLIINALNGFSQNIVTYQNVSVRVPNAAVTSQKFTNYDIFMNLAREAFNNEEYDKAFYYLKNAEKDKIHGGAFWFYLGLTVHHRGDIGASKRYLKKGFNDFGCWECGDVYEKLFNEKLKSPYP